MLSLQIVARDGTERAMPRANGITRQEILTSLKRLGAMTAEELHRELGISQVAVRQHLASLEAENIIAISVERRGLGRPSHRYMLTKQGDETFPRHYDTLANSLLDELRAWQGEETVVELLRRRRERLRTSLHPHLKDKPLPARIQELARILDESGYMTEAVQVGENSFAFCKRNCAVCAIARNHPDICCHGETAFLEELLGEVTVTREKSILDGDHHCEFRIQRR
jgi:predicted ArsR family transcriptional regulator